MKTIWKYGIPTIGSFKLQMPKGAEITTVAKQGEYAFIWALVNPTHLSETREFHIYGTGHDIHQTTDLFGYIGQFQQANGALVWHLFEVLPAVFVCAGCDPEAEHPDVDYCDRCRPDDNSPTVTAVDTGGIIEGGE